MEFKWFELWHEDRKCMLATMLRNYVADIEAGYNPIGATMKRQMAMIDAYGAETDATIEKFKCMEEKAIEKWCYLDLKKRGAIA